MQSEYINNYWRCYFYWMNFYLNQMRMLNINKSIVLDQIKNISSLSPNSGYNEYLSGTSRDEYEDISSDNIDYIYAQFEPSISPDGGNFVIHNCPKYHIVRIRTYRSEFIMIVDFYDRASISGYEIRCDNNGRLRFVPSSIEWRFIQSMSCAF